MGNPIIESSSSTYNSSEYESSFVTKETWRIKDNFPLCNVTLDNVIVPQIPLQLPDEAVEMLRKNDNFLQHQIDNIVNSKSRVIAIQYLESERIELSQPIYATLETDNEGNVIISSIDLDSFGYGDTESEAKSSFCESVVSLYFSLKEDKGKLGSHLNKIWKYLDQIVVEKKTNAAKN